MKTKIIVASVIVIGLALRLYVAACYPGGYDLIQLERSASIFVRGGNIYVEQFYFNYSPAIGLPLSAAYAAPFPFRFTWRLLINLVSLVNGLLVARLTKRLAMTFLLYWLNPALIIADGWTGQFEQMALLPLLFALNSGLTFAGGVLAVLIKHLLAPLTWCLYVYRTTPRRAVLWCIVVSALFLASFLPYLPDGAARIVERVLLYRSTGGYGFGSAALFAVTVAALPFVAQRLRLAPPDALLFCALGQIVTMPGMGSQYFTLVFVLGMLRPARWLVPLSALWLLFNSPWIPIPGMISGFNVNNLPGLVCVGWFCSILWNRREVWLPNSLLSPASWPLHPLYRR